MTKYLILRDRPGTPDQVLRIETELDWDGLQEAARLAVSAFLSYGGRDADNALSACNGNMTWSSLALWVPDLVCAACGFKIQDATSELNYADGAQSLMPEA